MEDGCPAEGAVTEFSTKLSIATIQPEPRTVPPVRALVRSPGPNEVPPEPRPYTLNEVGAYNPPRIVLPSFSVLSALVFPSIPREPHATFSLLGAERFQISNATQGELDMKLYAFRIYRLLAKLTISGQPAEGCM